MKIAYISIIPAFSSGIFRTIKEKADVSIKNDLNIDFYLLNPVEEYRKDNLHIIKKNYPLIPASFLRIVLFRLLKLKNIEKLIDLNKYDAIALRYPLVDSIGNDKFLTKYGDKIFTEHHTDEISELLSIGRKVDKARALLEKYFSKKFLSKIAGIIAVTEEIRKVELSKIEKNIPSIVIGNGISPDNIKRTGFAPFDNRVLKMIFVASSFAPWHGLENLLHLLKNYEGDIKIELNLVGNINSKQKQIIKTISNKNIKIVAHGEVYGEKLDELFASMNIAVSTLALSKNNMKEACPLKSREYIVRGIPFVYAYKDSDLNGSESFAKRFQENSISIEEIIKFAAFASNNKEKIEKEMKQYVKIISWAYKLTKMKQFIFENLNNKESL